MLLYQTDADFLCQRDPNKHVCRCSWFTLTGSSERSVLGINSIHETGSAFFQSENKLYALQRRSNMTNEYKIQLLPISNFQ